MKYEIEYKTALCDWKRWEGWGFGPYSNLTTAKKTVETLRGDFTEWFNHGPNVERSPWFAESKYEFRVVPLEEPQWFYSYLREDGSTYSRSNGYDSLEEALNQAYINSNSFRNGAIREMRFIKSN